MVGSTGDDKKTWVGHINHFIQIVLSAILTAKTFSFLLTVIQIKKRHFLLFNSCFSGLFGGKVGHRDLCKSVD